MKDSFFFFTRCYCNYHYTYCFLKALGKIGKVIKVYDDGDLRVTVDGQTWTLNPLCLTPLPGSATELHNTMAASVRQEHTSEKYCFVSFLLAALCDYSVLHLFSYVFQDPLASLLSHLLVTGPHQQPSTSITQPSQHLSSTNEDSVADQLVRAAAQGQFSVVEGLLHQYSDKADAKSSGKTCLQVASHQGHTELVRLLLSKSASLEIADDDGDTALHYAAFG